MKNNIEKEINVLIIIKSLRQSAVSFYTGYRKYIRTYHRIQVGNLGVDLEMTWGSCKEGRRKISNWRK